MPEDKTPAQVGYEAYGEAAGWKTWNRADMPKWDELSRTIAGQETQRRWAAATSSVLLAFNGMPAHEDHEDEDAHFYPGQLVKEVGREQWGFVVDARHSNTEAPRYRIILLGGNSEGFWTDGSDYQEVRDA